VAPDRDLRQAEILNKLIEISAVQLEFIGKNRIDELFEAQAERDSLFATLELFGKPSSSELKELASKLAESDRVLSSQISRVMDSIGSRLGQVKTGMSAVKAYGRY
jgi:hypothetical protein